MGWFSLRLCFMARSHEHVNLSLSVRETVTRLCQNANNVALDCLTQKNFNRPISADPVTVESIEQLRRLYAQLVDEIRCVREGKKSQKDGELLRMLASTSSESPEEVLLQLPFHAATKDEWIPVEPKVPTPPIPKIVPPFDADGFRAVSHGRTSPPKPPPVNTTKKKFQRSLRTPRTPLSSTSSSASSPGPSRDARTPPKSTTEDGWSSSTSASEAQDSQVDEIARKMTAHLMQDGTLMNRLRESPLSSAKIGENENLAAEIQYIARSQLPKLLSTSKGSLPPQLPSKPLIRSNYRDEPNARPSTRSSVASSGEETRITSRLAQPPKVFDQATDTMEDGIFDSEPLRTPVKKLVDAAVATEALTPSSQSTSTPSTSNSSNRSAGQLGSKFANQLLQRGRNPIVTVRPDGSVVEVIGTDNNARTGNDLEIIQASPQNPEDASSRPSSSQFRENSKILMINEISIPSSSAPPTCSEDVEDDQEVETISASVATKSEEESTLNQVSPIPSERADL
ncbi:hypothetical protein L596_009755 [Steinernema carpocapsae]|uniref:Uncharacterized protein n=1 Tax=Steinernema carpocapsae TaxID=34508 RepID=A0A4U5PGT1_STECR|nr:hypothetical protein L596_009755 [Steinernema carpocapsae]